MSGHAASLALAPPWQYESGAPRTTLDGWIRLIRSEYLESPGLHLTHNQAQRLWGLDAVTCDALLAALVDVGFLRRTAGGAFVRSSDGG